MYGVRPVIPRQQRGIRKCSQFIHRHGHMQPERGDHHQHRDDQIGCDQISLVCLIHFYHHNPTFSHGTGHLPGFYDLQQ